MLILPSVAGAWIVAPNDDLGDLYAVALVSKTKIRPRRKTITSRPRRKSGTPKWAKRKMRRARSRSPPMF